MQYDRDFLLQLQYSEDSRKKPDTLPNFPEIIPDEPVFKPDIGMRSGPGNYRDLPDFTPGFLRPSRGIVRTGPGNCRDLPNFTHPGFLKPSRDLNVKSLLGETSQSVSFREFDPGCYTFQRYDSPPIPEGEGQTNDLCAEKSSDQRSPLSTESRTQYDRGFLLKLQYSKHSMVKPDTLPNIPEIIPKKLSLAPRSGPGNYTDLPHFRPGFFRPLKGYKDSIQEEKPNVETDRVTDAETQPWNITFQKKRNQSHLDHLQPEPNILSAPPLPWCDLDPEKAAQILSRLKNPEGGDTELLMVIPPLKSTGEETTKEKEIVEKKMVADQMTMTEGLEEEIKEQKNPRKTWIPSPDERELYRKVRGILNKLTPQKFQTLIKEIQGLVIDTEKKLKGVTALIWEQATRDTAYAKEYASLCTHLLQVEVPRDGKPGDNLCFRKLLLLLSRKNFTEITSYAQTVTNIKVTDVQFEDVAKHRRKFVGIVRFIGEMFNNNIFTVEKIIMDCIRRLLHPQNEGKLDQCFEEVEQMIIEKKLSKRCHFLLEDVLMLRKNAWKPIRLSNSPKTIDEVYMDVVEDERREKENITKKLSQNYILVYFLD